MIETDAKGSAAPHLGSRLSERYVIERELGRGGMGTVYLARDVRLDRLVALKVLPAEFAGTPSLRERFLRETRTAASFSHPNIVPVYAVEEDGDVIAFAMAYVEGETVAERVKRSGPLGVRDTVRMLQDVGYALAYAHGRGVVHRDIKPDNIMIERATGRAMVMDFGISRAITASAAPNPNEGLTRVGEIIGTPEYMSPEQATGDTVDGRSDLYALGLTAHFALTGRLAISGETTGKVLMRQITELLPPIQAERPDLPPALAAAIDQCVQKDPAERFHSAEALVEALDAAQLAAPEIPLPIRLIAEEVGTLSMIIFFVAVMSTFIVQNVARTGNEDMALLVLLLIGVFSTRIMQTVHEVKRIASAGFSADDIQSGFQAVMAERDIRRDELLADPAVRKARKRTVITSIVIMAIAAVMFRAMFEFRHRRPEGGYYVDPTGSVLVIVALILFGVGFAMLIRSPTRMPVGERIFRLVWLGPIGRAFIRFSGRKVWRASGGTASAKRAVTSPVRTPRSAPPVTATKTTAHDPHIATLEKRVAELERWRKTL